MAADSSTSSEKQFAFIVFLPPPAREHDGSDG
jgi:hypothetical protein